MPGPVGTPGRTSTPTGIPIGIPTGIPAGSIRKAVGITKRAKAPAVHEVRIPAEKATAGAPDPAGKRPPAGTLRDSATEHGQKDPESMEGKEGTKAQAGAAPVPGTRKNLHRLKRK